MSRAAAAAAAWRGEFVDRIGRVIFGSFPGEKEAREYSEKMRGEGARSLHIKPPPGTEIPGWVSSLPCHICNH